LWGRISGQPLPDQLPQQAVELLDGMECDLVDEEDLDARWFDSIADSPNPGTVRDSVKSLAGSIKGNLL
jgi:hypothetical protein